MKRKAALTIQESFAQASQQHLALASQSDTSLLEDELLLLDGIMINDGIVDLPASKEPEDPVETQFDLYEGSVEAQDMDSAEELATVAASVSVEAFV